MRVYLHLIALVRHVIRYFSYYNVSYVYIYWIFSKKSLSMWVFLLHLYTFLKDWHNSYWITDTTPNFGIMWNKNMCLVEGTTKQWDKPRCLPQPQIISSRNAPKMSYYQEVFFLNPDFPEVKWKSNAVYLFNRSSFSKIAFGVPHLFKILFSK